MPDVRPIDANALEEYIRGCCRDCNSYDGIRCCACSLWDALDAVVDAPTLDYAPVRHGEWLEQEDFCGDTYYTCSACKNDWVCIDGTTAENGMHYCPNCGARMDGGRHD